MGSVDALTAVNFHCTEPQAVGELLVRQIRDHQKVARLIIVGAFPSDFRHNWRFSGFVRVVVFDHGGHEDWEVWAFKELFCELVCSHNF